jgi:hypothetical protein
MKLDFKTAFQAAKVPAFVLVVLTIVGLLFAFFGILSVPIQLAILTYAGYNGVTKFKLDLANGALAGAIASFLSMIFTTAAAFVQYLSGDASQKAIYAQAGISSEALAIYMLVGALTMLIVSPVIGLVFGAIGAYIAKRK